MADLSEVNPSVQSALVPTNQAVGLCACGDRLEPYAVSPRLSNGARDSYSRCHPTLDCPPLFGTWPASYTAGSKQQRSPLPLEQRVKQDLVALICVSLQDHTQDATQLPLSGSFPRLLSLPQVSGPASHSNVQTQLILDPIVICYNSTACQSWAAAQLLGSLFCGRSLPREDFLDRGPIHTDDK